MSAGGEDRSVAAGDAPQHGIAHCLAGVGRELQPGRAGGLLTAVGVVELVLGFGAAGWPHRGSSGDRIDRRGATGSRDRGDCRGPDPPVPHLR